MMMMMKNISRQFPLVLLVKVSWRQGEALESEDGNAMRSGVFEHAA